MPLAEDKSSFTALFERLAISLLAETTILGVARTLKLSSSEVDMMMRRAVSRGLQRCAHRSLRRIGIDEKSVKKRHVYLKIVSDLESGNVIWNGRGRKRETLDAFWTGLSLKERMRIEGVGDGHARLIR